LTALVSSIRFPYGIAFEEHERHLLVLAVAHSKRRPLYWLTRAEPLTEGLELSHPARCGSN